MFKHILLPSDGTEASVRAVDSGLRLAKEVGARVTALHVIPQFHVFTYKTEMIEDTREEFARDSEANAEKILSAIERSASGLGVPCETLRVVSDHPHEAIIEAATSRQCDLIAMASHGRKGVQALLLGSETQKVLVHSQIPVLVLR